MTTSRKIRTNPQAYFVLQNFAFNPPAWLSLKTPPDLDSLVMCPILECSARQVTVGLKSKLLDRRTAFLIFFPPLSAVTCTLRNFRG